MTYVDNSVYEEDNVLYVFCIRIGVALVLNGGEVTKCCEIGCFKAILPTYILLISIGYPMYTLVLVTFSFADSEKIARTSSRHHRTHMCTITLVLVTFSFADSEKIARTSSRHHKRPKMGLL